jgi:hypothetical protein
MAKNAKAPNSFAGRWRIISMKRWDQVFVDEEEDGCVRKTRPGRLTFVRYPSRYLKAPSTTSASSSRNQMAIFVKATAEQANVERLFPAIARYFRGSGCVEIGEQGNLAS